MGWTRHLGHGLQEGRLKVHESRTVASAQVVPLKPRSGLPPKGGAYRVGEPEDVLEVGRFWKGVKGEFILFQIVDTAFNAYDFFGGLCTQDWTPCYVGFRHCTIHQGELGESRLWRMQGVASKPSRTTADMEWLAQHHGWYCIADTMQITWQIFVSLSMFYLWSRRMLKYLSLASLQRKSLGRDPTLAEVGTHNASVSEDRSVSCPPNFSARVPVRCSCCIFRYLQSIGREDCGSYPLSNRFYCTEDNWISIIVW